jgi:hypothetical protein
MSEVTFDDKVVTTVRNYVNLVNGFCGRNATAALSKYQCLYPDQRQHNRSVFNDTPQSVRNRLSHATSALATRDTQCRVKTKCLML